MSLTIESNIIAPNVIATHISSPASPAVQSEPASEPETLIEVIERLLPVAGSGLSAGDNQALTDAYRSTRGKNVTTEALTTVGMAFAGPNAAGAGVLMARLSALATETPVRASKPEMSASERYSLQIALLETAAGQLEAQAEAEGVDVASVQHATDVALATHHSGKLSGRVDSLVSAITVGTVKRAPRSASHDYSTVIPEALASLRAMGQLPATVETVCNQIESATGMSASSGAVGNYANGTRSALPGVISTEVDGVLAFNMV